METQQAIALFENLPADAQRVVKELIELLTKNIQITKGDDQGHLAAEHDNARKASWLEEPAFGMWADRSIIQGNDDWLRQHRAKHWKKPQL